MAKKSTAKAVPAQRAGGAELFAFIAGAIGLVVDLVGLTGIIVGFVSLPTGSFLKGSPVTLSIVTLFSLLYSVILFLYFFRIMIRRRWMSQGNLLSEGAEEKSLVTLACLIWVPLILLWSIAIWRAGEEAGYNFLVAMYFLLFCAFATITGGGLLCEIVKQIDLALNPKTNMDLWIARNQKK